MQSQLETKRALEKEHLLKLNKLPHYWDYITIVFGELDICRFVNFNYEEATCETQKAIGWILLLLNYPKLLKQVFRVIFNSEFITQTLYDDYNSYIKTGRHLILNAVLLIENMQFPIQRNIITRFEEYQKLVKTSRTTLINNIKRSVAVEAKDHEGAIETESVVEDLGIKTSKSEENERNIDHSNQHKDNDGERIDYMNISNEEDKLLMINQASDGKVEFNMQSSQNMEQHFEGIEPIFPQQSTDQQIDEYIEEVSHGPHNDMDSVSTISQIGDEENLADDEKSNEIIQEDSTENLEIDKKMAIRIETIKQDIQVGECIVPVSHSRSPSVQYYSIKHEDSEDSNSTPGYLSEEDHESKLTMYLKNKYFKNKRRCSGSGHLKKFFLSVPDREPEWKKMPKKHVKRSELNTTKKPERSTISHLNMTNPELLYANEMKNEISEHIYTSYRRKDMLSNLKKAQKEDKKYEALRKFAKKGSHGAECGKKFKSSWFVKKSIFCHLGLNEVCYNGISKNKFVIPTYLYIKNDLEPHFVGQRAEKFLNMYRYVGIPEDVVQTESEYPHYQQIDEFMKARLRLNNLFSQFGEKGFDNHLAEVEEYKNLILNKCFVTHQQLLLIESGRITTVINNTNQYMQDHLDTCELCTGKSVEIDDDLL